METNHHSHNSTLFGTIGGTLLSVFASVQAGDVVKTVLLAFVGATTSFVCSYLLKQCVLWARSKLR
jgi:hypothetical protein